MADNIVHGGLNVYGYDLGIIMLDTTFPRIKGDVGNARTFPYPVVYKVVKNWTPNKVVLNLAKDDLMPFIRTAQELEALGVKAITSSCGFLSLFQNEIAGAVNVPVFTSALLMTPWVYKLFGSKGKIGILTANSETLTKAHLEAAGCHNVPTAIYGMQNEEVFTNFTVENWDVVDINKCKEELLYMSKKMLDENADIKAIVLECANMPPYTEIIQKETGVPVFDIVNLADFIIRAVLN